MPRITEDWSAVIAAEEDFAKRRQSETGRAIAEGRLKTGLAVLASGAGVGIAAFGVSFLVQPKIVDRPVVTEKIVTVDKPIVTERVVTVDKPVIVEKVIEKTVAVPPPPSPLQLPGATLGRTPPVDAMRAKTAAEFTGSQEFKTAELHGTIVSFIGGRLEFDNGRAFVPTPDNPERKTTVEFNGLPGFCRENPIGSGRFDCYAFKNGSAVHV